MATDSALARQGDSEIDCHGRLADTTLARRDRDDAGARRLVGKRVRTGRGSFGAVAVPTGTVAGAMMTLRPGGFAAGLMRRRS